MSDILTHSDFPWYWNVISTNINISLKDILSHPELPWDWISICHRKFLWEDATFKTNLKKDIKKRRETVKKLALFGSLETLVAKYIWFV
jgi:hypothetical protein